MERWHGGGQGRQAFTTSPASGRSTHQGERDVTAELGCKTVERLQGGGPGRQSIEADQDRRGVGRASAQSASGRDTLVHVQSHRSSHPVAARMVSRAPGQISRVAWHAVVALDGQAGHPLSIGRPVQFHIVVQSQGLKHGVELGIAVGPSRPVPPVPG